MPVFSGTEMVYIVHLYGAAVGKRGTESLAVPGYNGHPGLVIVYNTYT